MAITKATASSVAPAAAGDLVYGSGTNDAAVLGIGTAGQVLKVNSGATAPEWGIDPTADVVTTAGDLIYGTAADTVTRLGIGTANQVLTVNSGATAPEWGTISASAIKNVYYGTRTSGFTTTSASAVDVTGMTVTLTPQSATSKFIILLATQFNPKAVNYGSGIVVRTTTNILSWQQGVQLPSGNPSQNKISWAATYVDEPATTSSITYKFQVNSDGSATLELEDKASIIVLEI